MLNKIDKKLFDDIDLMLSKDIGEIIKLLSEENKKNPNENVLKLNKKELWHRIIDSVMKNSKIKIK